MNNERLLLLIEKALDERLKGVASFNDEKSFTGYLPLEKIRGGLLHWVAVPFWGTDVFCQLRCPNDTQLEQCGDISNILQGSDGKKFDYDELIKIRNYQEEICRVTFNNPTYDEISHLVGITDFVLNEKQQELNDLKNKIELNKDSLTETEKKTFDAKIKTLELQLGFILPDDTMAFITKWAMGNDISDIKKITKETFLRAASLAKIYQKAPSDYISGRFTDYNKPEIDSYAFSVLDEFLKEQETVKESKFRWIMGGKKKIGASLPPSGGNNG